MSNSIDEMKRQFEKETGEHILEILRDDGLYRHLKCTRHGEQFLRFDIITWPGFLCVCQNMGTFVFSRLPDMFEFFRGNEISPDYWAQKIEATEKHSGHEEFSLGRFRQVVSDQAKSWCEDESEADAQRILAEVEAGLLTEDFTFEWEARAAVDEFKTTCGLQFQDFWETDLHEFTPRYLWLCHAIQWAILKYDAVKVRQVAHYAAALAHCEQLEKQKARAEAAEQRLGRMTAAFFGISLRLSGIDQREITLKEVDEIAKDALRG